MSKVAELSGTKYYNLGLNSGSAGSYASKITVSAGVAPPASCEKAGVPDLSPQLVDDASPSVFTSSLLCVHVQIYALLLGHLSDWIRAPDDLTST